MISITITNEQLELLVSGLRCIDSEFGIDEEKEREFLRELESLLESLK